MKVSDLDLTRMLSFQPDKGLILFGGDRMLLFREEAFRELRKLVFSQLGSELARGILTQFGYRCGKGDYHTLTSNYEWDTEGDKAACGAALHSWEGIVKAEGTFIEFDRASLHYHRKGKWTNSYEADVHIQEFGFSDEPVCHTLTGYASGWASSFVGADCVAIETMCAGMGADHCEFEIRRSHAWGPEADPWKRALTADQASIHKELEEKLAIIERQKEAIHKLSTPILEMGDGVIVAPIIGIVDSMRSREIMDNLLAHIVSKQSDRVIIDVTGVEYVDTSTANYFLKIVEAAGLLGARCVVSGISPSIAQVMTEIGIDLKGVVTARSLKDALSLHGIQASRSRKKRDKEIIL